MFLLISLSCCICDVGFATSSVLFSDLLLFISLTSFKFSSIYLLALCIFSISFSILSYLQFTILEMFLFLSLSALQIVLEHLPLVLSFLLILCKHYFLFFFFAVFYFSFFFIFSLFIRFSLFSFIIFCLLSFAAFSGNCFNLFLDLWEKFAWTSFCFLIMGHAFQCSYYFIVSSFKFFVLFSLFCFFYFEIWKRKLLSLIY